MLTGQKRNKKVMRAVMWNGIKFESLSALGRHLRIYNGASAINKALKHDRPIQGHKAILIKKDK